ncbi:TlpA family protein disulfide reductase [Zhouia sp. PK063]|uniref:TlpA family protein disulfide reductase n=1 Tax=Zhouia sp. PK063 TaxID=3373602 RepID=UPI003788E0CC
MRKSILCLGVTAILAACNTSVKPDYTIVSGKIANVPNTTTKAFLIKNDFRDTLTLDNGVFKDTINIPEDGFYTFNVNREITTIYLTKGDSLNMVTDYKDFDDALTYTGSLAENNNYLASKTIFEQTLQKNTKAVYSKNPAEFKEAAKANTQTLDSLVSTSKTSDAFKAIEKKNNYYTYAGMMANYPMYHEHFAQVDSVDLPKDFYADVDSIKYDNEKLFLAYPAYKSLVSSKISKQFNENYEKTHSISGAFLATEKEIPNGKIKEDFLMNYSSLALSPDENMKKVYDIYMANLTSEENKDKIKKQYAILESIVPGKPSPTFNYENNAGGTTSLTDLKGKYVYVDVWATWCGPCKGEIPYLKKVEEEYHGKNIQFVSISIDEQKDHETWKNMIKEKELGGIQLMADKNWESDFAKEYNIRGIPRFILIDPQGNIVNADAPRPSNPELKELFDSLKI